MNKEYFKIALFLAMTCIAATKTPAQNDKLVGRWTPVRIVMPQQPEGMDIEWAEKALYAEVKKNADSAGKIINMNAADSAKLRATAKEVINEVFKEIYFRFNPDKTCYWNFGKLLDETEFAGLNVKGKYKIDEDAGSMVVTADKTQLAAGKEIKIKKDKIAFYYSFNQEQLRLEMDDGTVIFYLVKE
jgi:hypothetical protein